MKKIDTFKIIIAGILLMPLQLKAQDPVMEWARQMGGSGWNAGTAVTTDGLGNVYTTGAFEGTADFSVGAGGATFTASGRHIFISKLDAQGNFVWAKQIGVSGTNQGMAIKADSVGNVYIAGEFNGSPDFNPGTGTNTLSAIGGTDAYILKLNPAGEFSWVKNIGSIISTGKKIAYGMALDDRHVYITGEAAGDVFASKLDTSGNFIWTKTWGGAKPEYSYAIAVDNSGNVFTTGKFSSDSADFDPGTTTHYIYNSVIGSSSYNYEAFISKLDSAGNFLWAKAFNGGSGEGNGIVTDELGNVYASGHFRKTVEFNPGGIPNPMTVIGIADGYIVKYSPDGELIWARQTGGAGVVNPRSMAIDNKANLYISGWLNNWCDFNPATGPSDTFNLYGVGSNDIYICALDSAGEFVWAKGFGSTAADYGYAIAADKNRSIYGAGYFGGDLNFDVNLPDADFKNFGSQDIYVLKINQFCVDTSSHTLEIAICDDVFTINEETFIESGIYTQLFTNEAGCDSTLVINLNLKGKIEHPVINVDSFVLSTLATYDSYQWFLNGNIIRGATSRSITVDKNGDYQVAVANANGCTDTSDVYRVTNVTAIQDARLSSLISIYPNPTSDIINISPSGFHNNIDLKTIEGKTIKQVKNGNSISVKELAPGLYLLEIKNKDGLTIKVEKIIKK